MDSENIQFLLVTLFSFFIGYGAGFDRIIRKSIAMKKYVPHPSMQNLASIPMRIRISNIDYAPGDLYKQTPFEANILYRIPGKDRPDYWLAELTKPLLWDHNGKVEEISHIVLATRNAGEQLERGMKGRPMGIAYVTDKSLLVDTRLAFRKCAYVAIGLLDDISEVG